MTTTHTPLTQDEINEWHKIADGMPKAQEATRRLIAEVERLRADRDELKNGWAYANECLATATKEVEELRKDKERLDACLLGKKIRVQVHERYCTFSHEHKWKELLSREQIDAAMQQKGEE